MDNLEERECPIPDCRRRYPYKKYYCDKHQDTELKTDEKTTLIGKKIGNYKIERVIGAGGMGVVYLASNPLISAKVAVKVLKPKGMAEMRTRFLREAKLTMDFLQHPNIVKVRDCGEEEIPGIGKLLYLVMEYLEGESLGTILEVNKKLSVFRTVSLLSQICAAVNAAHLKRVVHRDLKPSNIVVATVDGEETVKVLDFGIAKLLEPDSIDLPLQDQGATREGTPIGSPPYMSPEQWLGRGDLPPQSDIYSLGVVTFELLCGKLPFAGPTINDFYKQHLREEPLRLRQVDPSIPQEVEEVVLKALAKDPKDRPKTANLFADALHNAAWKADGRRASSPFATTLKLNNGINKWRQLAERLRATPWAKWGVPAAILLFATGFAAYKFLPSFWPVSPTVNLNSQHSASAATTLTVSGHKLALIPGGDFTMGSNNSGNEDERPAHKITVPAFYLDIYEVTNLQYKKFVDETSHPPPPNWNGANFLPGEESLPVRYVTWRDASAYADWAGLRLPTEEEWEYAARSGGKDYIYPWGNQFKSGQANVGLGRQEPDSVESFPEDRNEFGIYGLAGNVSEWVGGMHLRYDNQQPYYPKCRECRVIRGGNYKAERKFSAATRRASDFPDIPKDEEGRSRYETRVFPYVGFRCAKSK